MIHDGAGQRVEGDKVSQHAWSHSNQFNSHSNPIPATKNTGTDDKPTNNISEKLKLVASHAVQAAAYKQALRKERKPIQNWLTDCFFLIDWFSWLFWTLHHVAVNDVLLN